MAKDRENEFTPKLGRLGDMGRRSGKRYIKRVLNRAGKINPRFGKLSRGSLFTGKYRGRGYFKEMSSTRQQQFRQRRVIIKARFVKLTRAGFAKAAGHIRYIQRDGITKEGEPGKLYDANLEEVDGEKFLEKAKDDRHQFRFIVSPEDAHEFDDMKQYTRDLMEQMETDLGTKLEWVAVDHYNTENPHTHIILRGVDDQGRDLVIAKDYLSRGFRERATALMTDELGPRLDHEIEQALRREAKQDRFTSVDRNLVRQSDRGKLDMRGEPKGSYAKLRRRIEMARLRKLETMGLANETSAGQWHLSDRLEPILRELGQKGDIIKTMHAEMKRRGKDPIRSEYQIYDSEKKQSNKVIGKLISKGLSDEYNDRYYLVVEGIDGKTHYADIGRAARFEEYRVGSIIELSSQDTGSRKTDHTIAEIAERNGGLYSEELHARHDPKASKEFIRSHIRRLEALRRANIAQRFSDGSWQVPPNYLDEVTGLAKEQTRYNPVKVAIRSSFSLDAQMSATGATWLDRNLVSRTRVALANTGFGAEVNDAIKRRRAYLVAEGFAKERGNGFTYEKGFLKKLEQREINKVASKIVDETGKSFRQSGKGDKIDGIYSRSVELASGRFAVIEKTKEFQLVPWRSVLERARGKAVSGVIGGSGISWDIGRKRGIGIS